MKDLLIGDVTLHPRIERFPIGGLTSRKLRVELSEEHMSDSAWISELEVQGDLPWYEEETRRVKVRIMSNEFRQHIECDLPTLLVRYGDSPLGKLKFDTVDE